VEGDPGDQTPSGDRIEVQVVLVQAQAFSRLAQVQDVLEPAVTVVADGGLELGPVHRRPTRIRQIRS
jgi:hypothetical protein